MRTSPISRQLGKPHPISLGPSCWLTPMVFLGFPLPEKLRDTSASPAKAVFFRMAFFSSDTLGVWSAVVCAVLTNVYLPLGLGARLVRLRNWGCEEDGVCPRKKHIPILEAD